MDAYIKWRNSLVNKNKSEIARWEDLKWLSDYTAAEAQESRNLLTQNLEGNWLFKETKPYNNQISKGCKLCGLGQWSCLFISGKCNAACFYCPTSQLTDDPPTTQNLTFPDAKAYAEYINHFNFKGVSFSGGEPLLFFDRTLEYLKQIRKRCNPDIYVWVYTNGILGDERKYRKLAAAGLNEIRFDIGATAYKLDKVRMAKNIIPNITVEVPAVPEEKERLKALLPQLTEAGVTNLNLHQLRLTKHNFSQLAKRNYTYIFAEHPLVVESELTALEILKYSREQKFPIGVNYCSFFFKNRFQKAGFRNCLASVLAGTDDFITQNGYIREYDGENIAYKALRIFDEKPDGLKVEEFDLAGKTLYFARETAMRSTYLDKGYRDKIEKLIANEPETIPDDPLLFRIWQLEYIEKGLREY